MKKIISALLAAVFALSVVGCQKQNSETPSATEETVAPATNKPATHGATSGAATADQSATAPTATGTVEDYMLYDSRIDADYFTSLKLQHRSAQLDVDEILQNPELPTGCESVALTAALRYLKYDLEKTEIAENYLSYGDDIMWDYVGDPTEYDGAGIYPPGLTDTANRFLAENRSKYAAYNTMGVAFENLLKLIDRQYPVVIWTTMDYETPYLDDVAYEYEGRYYYWYSLEHCVMLCGYDLDENTVTISDPMEGIITIDLDQMKAVYDGIGRLSMTIIDRV